MDGSTFFVCIHFRPRAGMATLTAMRRCSITGTNKMKKTLLFATALAATLAANAQNPIVPVQTLDGWAGYYIPKAFADAPYIAAIGDYDEYHGPTSYTIYNSNLQQVMSISTNKLVGMSVINFDEDFIYENDGWITFTQTLFNNDNRFEYISCVGDGDGYVVRFDIIADNGNVIGSFGNYNGMQGRYPRIALVNIGGNAYLRASMPLDIEETITEWYRIDRQTQRIDRVEGLPFNVFPSVADRDSYITVQFEEGATATELQVVDAQGRTLQRIPVAQGQQEVKVSARNLQSGINFIGDRRHGSTKIIVR